MPLATQILEFPFGGGVDEKSTPEFAQPGSYLQLENGIQEKSGAIVKRPGYDRITNLLVNTKSSGGLSVDSPVPERVFRHKNQAVVVGNAEAYTLTEEDDRYVFNDHISEMSVKAAERFARSKAQFRRPDVAYLGGYIAVAGEIPGAARRFVVDVIDAETGALVIENHELESDGLEGPRVTATADRIIFVWTEDSTSDMKAASLDVNTFPLAIGSSSVIVSSSAALSLDVTRVTGTTSSWVVAWVDGSANRAKAERFTSAFVSQGAYAGGVITVTIKAIAVDADETDGTYIAYNSISNNIQAIRFNNSMVVQAGPAQIGTQVQQGCATIAIGRVSSTLRLAVWTEEYDESGSGDPKNTHLTSCIEFDSAISIAGKTASSWYHVQLASKVLEIDERLYAALLFHDDQFQHSARSGFENYHQPYFHLALCDLMSGTDTLDTAAVAKTPRIVATLGLDKIAPRQQESASPGGEYIVSEIFERSTGVYCTVFPVVLDRGTTDASSDPYYDLGAQLYEFNTADDAIPHTAELGDNTLVSGGVLSSFDGFNCPESGFFYPPTILEITNAGAGNVVDATYEYIALYVYTDRAGNIYRSRPSLPCSFVASGGPSTIRLAISYLTVTNRQDRVNGYEPKVFIELYRRTGTATFRRVRLTVPVGPGIGTALGGAVENDPLSPHCIADDDIASVATEPEIYTDGTTAGSTAPFDPPPPSRCLTTWANRAWLASNEERNELHYSNERVDGEGIAFSRANIIMFEDEGGALEGVHPMDETLVCFKADRIYRIHGDGPDETLQGNSLTRPLLVTSDVGTTFGHAIVLTPKGLIFLSRRGFYLLDRSFQTHYIGAPVEDTVTAYPRLRAAHHRAGTNLYEFLLDDGSNSAQLIWDDFHNAWTTHKFKGGDRVTGGTHIGSLHYLVSGNGLFRQGSTYADETDELALTIVTPWYPPSEAMGWHRARRIMLLGRYLGSHQLKIEVGYDYKDNWAYSQTWSHSDIQAYSKSPVERMRWALPVQLCEAVRFRITIEQDATDQTNTAGARLTALRLETARRRKPSAGLEKGATR